MNRNNSHLPLLPRGQMNTRIDYDLLQMLPPKIRARYHRINLEKYFEMKQKESPRPVEPIPPILEIPKEKKIELKAIALGELKKVEDEKL